MSTLSPSVSRILSAATAHFAQRGYDGSSLSEIAEAAGMRKASLYAHFKNKDMLFMQSYMASREQELQHLAQGFMPIQHELPGFQYCSELINRYTHSAALQLFLRTSYMPPPALTPQIDATHEEYLARLSLHFRTSLSRYLKATATQPFAHADVYAEAYLGIVDSIQVKLIYTDAIQATQRLNAMQHLLELALQSEEKQGLSL